MRRRREPRRKKGLREPLSTNYPSSLLLFLSPYGFNESYRERQREGSGISGGR